MNQQLKNYIQRECEKGETGTSIVRDSFEWKCSECGQVGNYVDIRKPIDHGVDCCPDCRSPVICFDDIVIPGECRGCRWAGICERDFRQIADVKNGITGCHEQS